MLERTETELVRYSDNSCSYIVQFVCVFKINLPIYLPAHILRIRKHATPTLASVLLYRSWLIHLERPG